MNNNVNTIHRKKTIYGKSSIVNMSINVILGYPDGSMLNEMASKKREDRRLYILRDYKRRWCHHSSKFHYLL